MASQCADYWAVSSGGGCGLCFGGCDPLQFRDGSSSPQRPAQSDLSGVLVDITRDHMENPCSFAFPWSLFFKYYGIPIWSLMAWKFFRYEAGKLYEGKQIVIIWL